MDSLRTIVCRSAARGPPRGPGGAEHGVDLGVSRAAPPGPTAQGARRSTRWRWSRGRPGGRSAPGRGPRALSEKGPRRRRGRRSGQPSRSSPAARRSRTCGDELVAHGVDRRLGALGAAVRGRRPAARRRQRVVGAQARVLAEHREGVGHHRHGAPDVGPEEQPADHPQGERGHLAVEVDRAPATQAAASVSASSPIASAYSAMRRRVNSGCTKRRWRSQRWSCRC